MMRMQCIYLESIYIIIKKQKNTSFEHTGMENSHARVICIPVF